MTDEFLQESLEKGLGAKIVHEIFDYAREQHKKAVRLDILGMNAMAERLYTKCGFQFIEAKNMFYEDTIRYMSLLLIIKILFFRKNQMCIKTMLAKKVKHYLYFAFPVNEPVR